MLKKNSARKKFGLVLSGGGARVAYQIGVLRAISDYTKSEKIPFQIICSVSAGAINAAYLAARAGDFKKTTADLWALWGHLRPEDVFYTDTRSLGRTSFRWLLGISLGGVVDAHPSFHLLNTSPLKKLLSSHIDFSAVRENISAGLLEALSVSTTSYKTGNSTIFFDGNSQINPWTRRKQKSIRTPLSLNHVMASTALPLLFPPVKINDCFYGDGSIRYSQPVNTAIHLGADRVMAIGIKHPDTSSNKKKSNEAPSPHEPSIAAITGAILNAAFLDGLEGDIERTLHLNKTLSLISDSKKKLSGLRHIPVLALRPSIDLATIACVHFHRLPFTQRHLFNSFGASEEKGWDLLSYFTFDKAYTLPLMQLGYADALKQKDEILGFFYDSDSLVMREEEESALASSDFRI